jgi:hypothetical protein
MNASELADKLEYWRERVCDSQDIDNDRLSMSGFANIAFNNTREIAKSLRFAADMERLMAETWELSMTGPWPNGSYVIQTRSLFTVEKDIYAAARKAVEKLEGK